MRNIQGNKSQYGSKNAMGNTSSIRATINTNAAYSPNSYPRSPIPHTFPHPPPFLHHPQTLSTKVLPKFTPQPAKPMEAKVSNSPKPPPQKTQQQFKQFLHRDNKVYKHANDAATSKKKRERNQIVGYQAPSELRTTLDVVNFGASKSQHNSFKRQTVFSPKPPADVGFWKSRKTSPSKLAFNTSNNRSAVKGSNEKNFIPRNKGINRFRLFKLIGQGTFSDVYLGIEKKTFTLWAIKRLKKSLINTPQLKNQMAKVISFHLKLTHPNIIRIYEVFSDENYVYIVEEFMESGTLQQLILKNNMPMKQNQIGEKLCEIVSATRCIHQMNYIHGGLKPSSILICLGTCKLPNIQSLDSGALSLAAICKSLNYTPPEALSNKLLTNAYDMWCIGLILYELVMTRPLFSCISQKTLMRNILNFSLDEFDLPENTSYQIQGLLRSLLQPNPKNRMTIEQMIEHNFVMEFRGDIQWGSMIRTDEKSGLSSATFDE